MMPGEVRDPRTYAIIGAAMEVHRELGPGFLEAVYQESLDIEMSLREIPHCSQTMLSIHYKDRALRATYKPDFVCHGAVIVEIKAISSLTAADDAQTLNYLAATGMEVALLLNFGRPSLEYKRLIRSSSSAKSAKSAASPALCMESAQ